MLKAVIKKRAHEDIVKQIRHLIDKGKLKRGDQLPTERESHNLRQSRRLDKTVNRSKRLKTMSHLWWQLFKYL
jgi:DNA-binding transcriptional MocR family regulator